MKPATFNFDPVTSGNTLLATSFELALDEDTPIDLSDAEIKAQFRSDTHTGRLRKTISIGSGITLTDPENGIFTVDQMDIEWPAGSYVFDILIKIDDVKTTYISGKLQVLPNVTENV
jgi:hypothetical protein